MAKKENSAVENFLEGVEEDNKVNAFELPTEVVEETDDKKDDEVKEEKPLPFHKDPKIQKYLDKREKEIEDRLTSSMKKVVPVTQTEDEFKEVIDSFTTIIGNDTPEKINALNALSRSLKSLDEKAIRRAEEKIQEIRDSERAEEDAASEELDAAFENIEDTYDVDLTSPKALALRKEFVTFVEKIAPKNRQGEIVDYPDMPSAWETFSEIKNSQKTPSRAKELASQSMARSVATTATKQERVDWNKVDEYMDGLKT